MSLLPDWWSFKDKEHQTVHPLAPYTFDASEQWSSGLIWVTLLMGQNLSSKLCVNAPTAFTAPTVFAPDGVPIRTIATQISHTACAI